jgi:type I restriction enzyme S subunit
MGVVPEGYKETEIGIIPKGWGFVRLDEVCNINPPKEVFDGEVSFVKMEDVTEDAKLRNFSIKHSSEVSTGFTFFKNNDVIVAKITPCFENGKGALINNLINNCGFGSTEFHVLRVGDNILSEYIYYHTISAQFRGKGELNMVGTAGQKRIPKNFISSYIIPLPPLPEQQKIAEILSTWDNSIENLENLISKKIEIKKGLMQNLLTGNVRFPGFEDEWKEVKLEDICSITTGKLNANAMQDGGKYKFFTCAREVFQINTPAFDTEALLVSGNGANVGYIHYYCGKFNAYQRTYVLDDFTENILFVKFLLECYLPNRINREKNAGNTPYIVLNTLSKMKLRIPSIPEQQKIASVLSTQDKEIDLLKQKLELVKTQKKGLMQNLLTGKVRVNV